MNKLFSFCLISTFILVQCLSQKIDLIDYMTEEEISYLKTVAEYSGLPKGRYPSEIDVSKYPNVDDYVRKLNSFSNDYVKQVKNVRRKYELLNPPAIFKTHHEYVLQTWKNITTISIVLNKKYKNMNYAWKQIVKTSKSSVEYNRKMKDIETQLKKITNEITIEHNRAIKTQESASKRVWDEINKSIRLRAGLNSSNISNLIQPTISLEYQPFLIPVKIGINTDGEVYLECEESIPTPIGIFSIKTDLRINKEKVLRIFYKDKKYVYKLEDKPFTFNLYEYNGSININYDENLNMSIYLNDS